MCFEEISSKTIAIKIMLPILSIKAAQTTYPTGNKSFSVQQAFPAAFSETHTDPFLMCDFFGPSLSQGTETDPDSFPVRWHPHRGFDICTYLVEGIGRHADSLGNRGNFPSPGMQWIQTGSGIEHAEGVVHLLVRIRLVFNFGSMCHRRGKWTTHATALNLRRTFHSSNLLISAYLFVC